MKKIIYSLVIMIAAGSLFTSCIEQVEPLGIQDMRFAKAEYIRALKDLRAADAELVRAEAAHELARARYVDAMTANLNADTEYQQLLNEYQQLINEARQDTNDFISQEIANRIDSVKKRMELREKQHAAAMVAAEDSLVNAQERLRVALRNIALFSQALTPAEKHALQNAAKAYEKAFTETANQTVVVMQAQRTLDSLKMVREVGAIDTTAANSTYDKESKAYIGAVEKWNKDIEKDKVKQALYTALLLAVPDSLDYEDVNAWQAQLDQLSEDSAAVAYNQYQTKIEMSQYYTANIHDGVTYFNTVASEWKKANKRPTWTEIDSTWIAAGEPKREDYPDTPNLQDSIPFPKFQKGKVSTASFNKFAYLLGSYDQVSLINGASKVIEVKLDGADADTIIINGPVSQKTKVNNKNLSGMKNFILGAAGTGEEALEYTYDGTKSPAASYGLWGAYDILEREYVTAKAEGYTPEQIEGLKKDMEAKDSIWTAHSNILKNGLTKYEPYTTALAKYKSAVETNDANKAEMVAAIDNMMTQIERSLTGTNDAANFRYDDSLALFDAMVRFAKAREAYLDYAFDPEGSETFNRDYFYYASGTDSHGKVIVDSVLFSAMSFDALRANDYDKDASKTTLTNFVTTESTRQFGLANIANQLFNGNVATALLTATFSAPAVDVVMTKDAALYNMYTYDPATKTLNYAEMPEVAEAKKAVLAAVASFVDVYNQFWGYEDANGNVHRDSKNKPDGSVFDTDYNAYFDETSATAKATKLATAEGKVEIKDVTTQTLKYLPTYTLATFKPYSDEDKTPIVTFTADSVDKTPAVLAILTSVDPACTDRTNNEFFKDKMAASILHKAAPTSDLYKAMKAEYDYWKATTDEVVKDLEIIKDWIENKVVDAFTKDAARKTSGQTAYNNDKKAYDTAVARKPRIEDWRKKLQEFAGEGAWEESDIVTLTAPSVSTGDDAFTTINDVLIPELIEGKTAFDTYPGVWAENLGGQQLALAEELFPDYPEEIAEWYDEIKEANDELTHYQVLIKAAKEAYVAAATVAEENVGGATTWDDLITNYKEANRKYRERIMGIIKDYQDDIEKLEERIAKFKAGIPQLDIRIAEAEKELAIAKTKLEGYEQVLAYAKANLDHMLEYIKSLDAEYVIFTDNEVK